jgi:hypothetical protein
MWVIACIWYMGTCTSHNMGTSNDTFSICHDIFNGNWFIDVT